MEGLEIIQDALDKGSSIDNDLVLLEKAKTDKQILTIAHRIIAKLQVRRDMVFEIKKAINEFK